MKRLFYMTMGLIYLAAILLSLFISIKPGAAIYYKKFQIPKQNIIRVGNAFEIQFKANGYFYDPKSILILEDNRILDYGNLEDVKSGGNGTFRVESIQGDQITVIFAPSTLSADAINEHIYRVYIRPYLINSKWGRISSLILVLGLVTFFGLNLYDPQKRKMGYLKQRLKLTSINFGNRRLFSTLYYLICYIFAIYFIYATSGYGADTPRYMEWTGYFLTGDISIFRGYPTNYNVPFIQWHYGPGIFTALISRLLFLGLDFNKLGFAIGVINLFLVALLLSKYIKLGRDLIPFIIVLIIPTPIGFYLNKVNSEAFTILFSLLFLVYFEYSKPKNIYIFNLLVQSIILSFLLLVRFSNIFIVIGLILITLANINSEKDNYKNLNNKLYILIKTGILLFFPFLQTCLQFYYNYIVTGEFYKFTYNVGDKFFNLFSFNLKVSEILFSSWHGLVVYHPMIIIMLLLILFRIRKFTSLMQETRLIIFFVLGICVIQIIFQGTWFIWWMGMATFGARWASGLSVLIIYSLLPFLDHWLKNRLRIPAYLYCIIFLYSLFLFILGHSNFPNYSVFFTDLIMLLQNLGFRLLIIVLILFSIITLSFPILIRNRILINCLFFFSVIFTIKDINYIVLSNLFLSVIIACILWVCLHKYLKPYYLSASSILFAIILIVTISMQTKLLINFQQAKSTIISNSQNAVDCVELNQSYDEYLEVQGYQNEKTELFEFMTRHNCLDSTQ